jgi:hypothetical protein
MKSLVRTRGICEPPVLADVSRWSLSHVRARCETRMSPGRDDVGASLMLAIAMLLVCSVVLTALLGWARNDLNNVAHFRAAESLQSAVNSATEVAVQNVRYNFTGSSINQSPPVDCAQVPISITSGKTSVAYVLTVWCSTAWSLATSVTSNTRVVTFSTCLSSSSASSCATTPLLRVVATMDDYGYPVQAANTTPCSTTCGSGMTINSWVQNPKS